MFKWKNDSSFNRESLRNGPIISTNLLYISNEEYYAKQPYIYFFF